MTVCAVTGETDTDTASAPVVTVGRRQTRSELPAARFVPHRPVVPLGYWSAGALGAGVGGVRPPSG